MSRICSSLSGGELFEQITSEGYVMSEAEVINYMRQICEGVKHMHERNIIHLGECGREDKKLTCSMYIICCYGTCSILPGQVRISWQLRSPKLKLTRKHLFADIKPENVMCQTSKSTNIKIIDFGLATKLDPNELVKISTGTAEFAAPEIVEREPVGFYTDMWSIGVLAYVLLSG